MIKKKTANRNRTPSGPSRPSRRVIAPNPRTLRRNLLSWYTANHRTLPWRTAPGSHALPPDPYRILVSEAMLQQTQVATVIDYFDRFVAAFPTVQALAGADEQRILRLWQGLGYYRRARHLHQAAKIIVTEHDGVVPTEAGELLKLPGVGRYTAGAVASIAYGRRAAVLDGNVARVLARLYAVRDPINAPATRTRLWELAQRLVPRTQPGDFNQALMELGALICLPRAPRCERCPVAKQCLAHRGGLTEQLPATSPKPPPVKVTHHVIAIEHDGRYLFQQRPEKGLWSRMWQMPTAEADPGRLLGPIRLQKWVSQWVGLPLLPPRRVSRFSHQTTHRSIEIVLWRVRLSATPPTRLADSSRWRLLNRLEDLPLAKPQRRIVSILSGSPKT